MLINERQKDALTEILNIAIGRAARALNLMVKEEITLAVPEVDFLRFSDALPLLGKNFNDDVCAVKQEFQSIFSGDALLVFPEKQSLKLVESIIGDMVDNESMTELEQETMVEVGNVLLNSCLSSLADQLKIEIKSTMPSFISGGLQEIVHESGANREPSSVIMVIKVMFQAKDKEISGYILLIFDMNSSERFIHSIDNAIARVEGL